MVRLYKPAFLARGGKLVYLVYLVHLVYLVCFVGVARRTNETSQPRQSTPAYASAIALRQRYRPAMRKHTDILRALVPVLYPNDSRPKDAESDDVREVASSMAEDYAIDVRLVPT